VVAALVGAGAWLLIWSGIRVGHETGRPCDYDCPPVGGRYALIPVLGIVLNVFLGVMLVVVLRLLGFGIALGLGSLAAVAGWNAAVADGRLSAETVSGYVGFWGAVAIVGAVIAVLGLLVETRLPGPVWRLFGWVPTPAELRDYTGPPNGSGTAVLAFTDRDRAPRQVVVPVRQRSMWVPVRAWYPAGDPSRARIQPIPLANRKD
jgi:hypothetical protein